jgi:hypothetical protein
MKALNMTELQYGEMVEAAGKRWMTRYFGTEPIILSALNHSQSFWAWWVKQWDNRDGDFINEFSCLLQVTTQQLTKELYDTHQDPDKLKAVPDDSVVKEVGKLLKAEVDREKALKNEQPKTPKANG